MNERRLLIMGAAALIAACSLGVGIGTLAALYVARGICP